MILNIGSIYKITFDTGFTAIDGVYKVLQFINHDQLLTLEIDLFTTLYVVVGKTQEDYDIDILVYATGRYYQIEDVTDGTKYYVPEGIISTMPEVNINEYQKLVIAFDIGTFDNTEQLSLINTTIQELLTTNYGITASPQLMTYDKVWLTDEEYATIEETRASAKTGAINYYSESIRLEAERVSLNTKVIALENIIVAMQ